jgi:TfoX/Sxy family transcriptional regulator of competence genes
MKYQQPSPELIALFHAVLPDDTRIERRKMFGYDAAFMNGNLFGGIFETSLTIRLGDAERAKLLAMPGAAPFEPVAGKVMKEYVVLPAAMHADRRALVAWYLRAFKHASSLPVKRRKY